MSQATPFNSAIDTTSPSTVQSLQSYMTPMQNALKNPSSLMSRVSSTAGASADAAVNNPQSFLTKLRNLDSATLTTVGVVAAETIGFFSVGEMIGRFHIVGYRSSAPHAGH